MHSVRRGYCPRNTKFFRMGNSRNSNKLRSKFWGCDTFGVCPFYCPLIGSVPPSWLFHIKGLGTLRKIFFIRGESPPNWGRYRVSNKRYWPNFDEIFSELREFPASFRNQNFLNLCRSVRFIKCWQNILKNDFFGAVQTCAKTMGLENAIFGRFWAGVAPCGSVVPKSLLYFVGLMALNILIFRWLESAHIQGRYRNSNLSKFHFFRVLWPTFTQCDSWMCHHLPRITATQIEAKALRKISRPKFILMVLQIWHLEEIS